jgi:Ca-activated chloride channel family protein
MSLRHRARRHLNLLRAVLIPVCAVAVPAIGSPQDRQACTEDAMIVFDASRSMDAADADNAGLRRIDSVRGALARILPDVARRRRLGLVTYGPGESDACSNVTLELMPASNAAQRIMDRVNALKPDGRTPLTQGVRVAADALRYREQPATIVLLTDGEETCKADPCALARTLKAGGAGVTVHVISYRIEDSLGSKGVFKARCLADETGGTYASASTAEEVAEALRRALLCPLLSEACAVP